MRRALVWIADLALIALVVWRVWPLVDAVPTRIRFPGDLEWMEGATMVSAWRSGQGLSIYGQPALDYIPFIYPPLYAWLVGALGHVFPLGYALARTVSAVCAGIASLALVYGARREGASWGVAVGALGAFVACWDEGGTFYDLVRTDSLSIALLGWALVLGKERSPWPSALLLAVAFAAKQHAAMFGIPMLAWRWRAYGKADALRFAAASAGPALLFTAVLTAWTGGGFWTWLVTVPAVHGVVAARLFPQAQVELWKALPVACTFGLVVPFWFKRNPYWLWVSGMGLVVTTIMRGHVGGFVNVLIPGFWLLALWPAAVTSSLRHPAWRWVAMAVTAAQLVQNDIPTAKSVPTERDAEAARQLVETLETLPEPILMPHGPWYLVMAGKDPSFALICLWDADRPHGAMRGAVDLVKQAMDEHHWQSAVLPDDKLGYGLKDDYERDRSVRLPAFSTRAGWSVRWGQVWKPKATPVE